MNKSEILVKCAEDIRDTARKCYKAVLETGMTCDLYSDYSGDISIHVNLPADRKPAPVHIAHIAADPFNVSLLKSLKGSPAYAEKLTELLSSYDPTAHLVP